MAMEIVTIPSGTTDRSEFVQTIIEEAILLIQSKGFEQMKLSNLSIGTGYSLSHIYNYFGNRLGVLNVVIEHLFNRMKAEILENVESDLGFADLFILLLHRRRDFVLKNKVLELYFNRGVGFSNREKRLYREVQNKEDILFADISSFYYGTKRDTITFIGLDFRQIWSWLLSIEIRNRFLLPDDSNETEEKIRLMFNAAQVMLF